MIRFGLSKSRILSWGGTAITYVVSMLTKICWQMTLVTSWLTKDDCIYYGVFSGWFLENIILHMITSTRYIPKKKSVILLAIYDPWYFQVLQEQRYVSMLQVWYPLGSWTICSNTNTRLAVIVNPHWFLIGTARGQWAYDGDDMYRKWIYHF